MRYISEMKSFSFKGNSIPSRFFLAPINTGFTDEGQPNEKLQQFHYLRSGRGIGISYVGNVAIEKEYVTNNKTAYFDNKNNKMWKKLTSAISDNGSLPGVQLGCRVSAIKPIRENVSKNIEKYIRDATNEFSSYEDEFFDKVIKSFVRSAIVSWNVGFKVIQIHAAHGYLLSLSLSNTFNKRTDKYGNYTYLIGKIVNEIRKNVPECLLDIRISYLEGIKDKWTEENEKQQIIKELASFDIDIISISCGIYNVNKFLIYPKLDAWHAVYENIAIKYAEQYPNILWNVAGNIYNLKDLKGLHLKNLTYSICRSLIADNCFIEKYESGHIEKIKVCERCDRCHYYSNSEEGLIGCLYK